MQTDFERRILQKRANGHNKRIIIKRYREIHSSLKKQTSGGNVYI